MNIGTNLILFGIVIQLFTITLYLKEIAAALKRREGASTP